MLTRGSFGAFMQALHAFSRAQAAWEIETSRVILTRRKLLLALAIAPILLVLLLQAVGAVDLLPEKIPILGGSKAYMPALVNDGMFFGSIFVGLVAGLITGVIGAGGGYILTPALMSFGVRGIMAVGTDQFHLFAKAIMGTIIHRKLGNVNIGLAAAFVVGSLGGVSIGGYINRMIFQHSPAMSDALISTVYVVVLGLLGFTAIAELKNLRKSGGEAHDQEELTGFAKRLQGLPLSPKLTFDAHLVPGGRTISIYPLIVCGFIVGFVAAIMGVGGGFLTFPMFVYGLGVSTFTTVGTDILQIIFTTSYSSIFQYAIYGFVFYTVAIGMLIGSLVGVQIGAMVTKMVKGVHIRVFYALTILAGFTNRLCALPRKLSDLGYISMSRETAVIIEQVGTVLFFAIVGFFALWILAVFLQHVAALRLRAHPLVAGRQVIVDRRKFALGVAGLVVFAAMLVLGFFPLYRGDNALQWADRMFNRLAKDSANYIETGKQKAEKFVGLTVDLGVNPKDNIDKAELARLIQLNGLDAGLLDDGRVRITGNFGQLTAAALQDAETAFNNENRRLEVKYGMSSEEVIYCWWIAFDGLTRRYLQENRATEANFTKFMTTKVLEPTYNFRGIHAYSVKDNALQVIGLLVFYIIYTLWYGFSIMLIFEGLGITVGGKRKEIHDGKQPAESSV